MVSLLETNRLRIREYRPSDLLSIHQYASQPIVVQYQNWGPNSLEDTYDFLQQVQHNRGLAPRMSYELCIERKEDKQLIGGCELAISLEDHSIATMGYILNPQFWNQGYATEISSELLRFGFSQLGLRLIRATCDAQNKASIRVLEKSGFHLETTLVDDFMQKGTMRTTLVYISLNRHKQTGNLN
ncbi:GNAT family N-acetyltransferase [Spirosoma panaciterrae]|uniref:GNAT family N-acetyltransferase n=1 Tax=Spirosoma panaciterrae TaxID=496058 RepID=UPI000367C050|nr:GNAT family protein [Spirosoma panaciterrae]